MEPMNFIVDVGFPIAAACVAGYFVFLTLKFILATVTDHITQISDIISRLDVRVSKMSDVLKMIDNEYNKHIRRKK